MKRKRIMALKRTLLLGCLTAEELADIAQRAVDLRETPPITQAFAFVRVADIAGHCRPRAGNWWRIL